MTHGVVSVPYVPGTRRWSVHTCTASVNCDAGMNCRVMALPVGDFTLGEDCFPRGSVMMCLCCEVFLVKLRGEMPSLRVIGVLGAVVSVSTTPPTNLPTSRVAIM